MIPLLMAVCLSGGLYLGNVLTPVQEDTITYEGGRYEKMQDIIRYLDNNYVDSVDTEEIFEQAIGDMLHKLDPHSNYIPAKDMAAMNEDIKGQFGGIGIRFFVVRDTVYVTDVLPDSPSEEVGVKVDDRIVSVDGEDITGELSSEEIVGKLKGPEGTKVKVGIIRDGKKLEKEIRRGIIPVESVTVSYMLTKDIGFIKIERFSVTTAAEFRLASQKLKAKGMEKLIIDLRDNPGGVLTGATQIADELLRPNLLIVETKGLHSRQEEYRSTANGRLKDIEVAILINENSASASEILAGAIQDNDRGIIVGRRSYGKGLVQEDKQLRDGSYLRLTIARYYTPTGRCIQMPYTEDISAYYEEHYDRYANGELYAVDSSKFNDSLKYTTPKGKVVYGGGGIMPDVFIPLDSTGRSWYLTQLSYSSAFMVYAIDFSRENRGKWKGPQAFADSFSVSDQMLDRFTKWAAEDNGVKFDEAGFQHSKELIRKYLKWEIARQLWMVEGYFEVKNKTDREVQEVVEILKR